MKKSTYCMEIGQGVKSLRGSDRGFDCRLTVVRPSADRRFRAVKVLTVLLLILTVGVGTVFATTPFTEGFESSVPPTGWSTIHVKGSSWTRAASDYYMTVHSGSYHAKIGYSSSGGDNYLITPQLSPVVGETMKFYIGSTTWGGSTLTVEVSEAGNSSASDFTAVLATYHSKTDINKTWGDAKEISLSAYAGKNIYIAFHMVDTNGDNVYIDDFSIEAPETCPKPTDLFSSNLETESVDLSWTAGGSEPAWNVLYKAGSADWVTVENVTSNPYTLSVVPSTSYQVKVQAVCGVGDVSLESNTISFTTPCEATTLPIDEDFSSALSSCWSRVDCHSETTVTDGKFKFRYNTTPPQYLITPGFVASTKVVSVEFDYWIASTSFPETFQVGYSTTTNELSSFTYDDEVTATNKSTTLKYSTTFPIGTKYVAIRYNSNDMNALFIDNLKIKELSSCHNLATLSDAAAVTSEGATFTWTTEGTENRFQYACVESGETPSSWTLLDEDVFSYTLTGLAPETSYDFYVRAYCSEEEKSDYLKKSFTTLCGAVSLPLENDFSSALSSCWTRVACETNSKVDGGKFQFIYNTNPPQYLITPEFNSAGKSVSVEFKYWIASTSFPESFQVGYSTTTNEVSAFTYEEQVTATNTSALTYTTTFPAEAKYIAIKYNSNDMSRLYIDDLKIKAVNSCLDPSALSVVSLTSNGATLSWTAGGTEAEWEVQYSTSATFASDNHEVSAATNTNFALTGLTPSTKYYVHVKAVCGSESESNYSDAISFTTPCAAIPDAISWTEDFEEYATGSETSEAPGCWSFSNVNVGNPKPYSYVSTSAKHNGSNGLYLNAFGDEGYAFVIFPEIATALNTLQIRFWHQEEIADAELVLGYLTNVANSGTFTSLHSCTASVASWTEETIDLSKIPAGARLAFRYLGSVSSFSRKFAYIDDITFEALPTCFKPATLNEATAITPDGATFSWTASGKGETQYQYAIAASGETPDWSAATPTSALTATVSGLAAGTYDFYVRSYCSAGEQSEAVSKSFTTATVPAPESVNVTGITNNSASAEWTAPSVAYAVQYQYSLVQSGDPVWSTATSDLSHLFENLEANTAYTLYVRTYFDATHTGAQASTSFTTMCDPIVVNSAAYEENFSSFPACWNNDEGTTTNNSYKWSSVAGGKEGNGMRFESKNNASGNTNVLASPIFTINTDADLTFWMKNKKGGDYTVEISVNGAARTTLIGSMTNIADWTMQEVSLSECIGQNIQLFFCGTSNWSESADGYLYLDELAITPITCRKPAADPTVDSKDATSATISWPAVTGATGYQFCLVEKDETPVWEDANIVSSPTKTLSGLEASNSYDFYVRNYCDDSNQSEARKVSFRTGCGTITTLPWEENFESVTLEGKIPECWASVGDLESYSYEWKHANYIGKNSSKGMQCGLAVEIAGKTNILATPSIQLGEGDILSFWCKNIEGDNFVVEISSDGGVSKNQILDLTSVMTDWTLKYVNLTAYNNQEVIFYFKATSPGDNNGDMIYIDNVRVARGEFFDDAAGSGVESRIAGLENETLDFIMNRPMQFEGSYNTLCLPFDLSAEQLADADCPLYNNTVKVFDYARVAASELQLAITGASSIHAGVPCFVKYDGTAEAPRSIFLFKDVTIKTGLNPKADGEVEYRGIYNPIAVEAETDNGPHHIIFVGAENQLYWPGADRTMRGFRAYFYVGSEDLEGNPIRRGIPARLVEHTDSATGMDKITDQPSAFGTQKVLENDQVIILRNGVKYNMQGQVIR